MSDDNIILFPGNKANKTNKNNQTNIAKFEGQTSDQKPETPETGGPSIISPVAADDLVKDYAADPNKIVEETKCFDKSSERGEVSQTYDTRGNLTKLSGDALCLTCGHEWKAVTDIGVHLFRCPKCRADKGVWAGFTVPPVGSIVQACIYCGFELFTFSYDESDQEAVMICGGCGNVSGLPDKPVE